GPAHISVADLNHDGHLDLIITFRDDRNIGVVLGNGDGTFGAQTDHFVPGSSPFLFGGAVADFNGDGNLDFVVADQTSNSVTIFYGAGNGSLTVSPAIAMGNTPYEVVAADFNGDGIPDLATANGTAPAAFTVRLGTGGGSFGAANSFIGSGFGGLSMTVADFDGDGVLDAALVNFSNTSFTVFHGNGDGSFTAGVTYGVGTQPISIMSGDLDGDGNIDIATANEGSNNVTVRFGDGAGGFAESVTRIVDASLPASIAAADFHGIGKMDLATANINSFNVSVLANICTLSVEKSFASPKIPPGSTTTLSFTLANSTTNNMTGVSFADPLPAGLSVAAPANLSDTCIGGTFTASGSTISLSGASLPASDICMLSVDVTATGTGTRRNVTNRLTSTENGPGGLTAATLSVADKPVLTKSFGASSLAPGSTTTLSFTLQNPNATAALTGLAFTDALPGDLRASTADGVTGTCGGGTIAMSGSGDTVTLSGATLAAASSCSFSVNVSSPTFGKKHNVTSTVTSNEAPVGDPAAADVTFGALPAISKAFGAPAITLNTSTSLTFQINNPNDPGRTLTGVAFTDNLPAGVVVATPNGLTGSCGGGTITATADATSISLSGATLAGGSGCTFSVNVTATTVGHKTNVTSKVTANETGDGAPAVALLFVTLPAPASMQATALSSSQVKIDWSAVPGAAQYGISRSSPTDYTAVDFSTTQASTTLTDTLPAGIHSYLYVVVAFPPGAGPSDYGDPAIDVATTILFTNDGDAGPTLIKQQHFDELYDAINAIRTLANIDVPFTFPQPITAGSLIRASNITSARTAIDAARTAMSLPLISYSHVINPSSTPIRKEDVQELRDGVK
ncbi:MAG: FG-GAP repeat domain-containing protein, partial [Thermoanaerobaculia bacterium]